MLTDDMYYEELANTVRYYKENKEGKKAMCSVIEEMRKEKKREKSPKKKPEKKPK